MEVPMIHRRGEGAGSSRRRHGYTATVGPCACHSSCHCHLLGGVDLMWVLSCPVIIVVGCWGSVLLLISHRCQLCVNGGYQ
jgi:hypothetical protein